MVNMYKKFVGSVLGGKGQVVLLFLILAVAAAAKFVLAGTDSINLNQLGFSSTAASDQGIVVYSDSGKDLFLILDRGNLHWRKGEDIFLIAKEVINVHIHEGRFWIKTRKEISELIISNGAVVPQLSANSPGCQGIPFADARLVGTGDQRFYLSTGPGVRGIAQWGPVEGPYYLEGRRRYGFIEPDWRLGAAFVRDNSWTVYVNYMPQTTVHLDYSLGKLQEVVLSPDASYLVYAVQHGPTAEIWHARITGSEAVLLYQGEMQFSSLEAVWSPDMSMMAVSVLGYEGTADFNDNIYSATFFYQPGLEESVMLNKSCGPEIRALVPTAWDARQPVIWFNWLHEEAPIPVSYRLFSQ